MRAESTPRSEKGDGAMSQEPLPQAQESLTVVLDGIGGCFAVPHNVLEAYRLSGQRLEAAQQRLAELDTNGEVSGYLLNQQPMPLGMPPPTPPSMCPPPSFPMYL